MLHSEPTIRLVLVASRLAQYANGEDHLRPSLPTFTFWLRSLRTALDTDPFWGSGYWAEIEARALGLEKGIQDLLQQCGVLEDLVAGRGTHVGKRTTCGDNGGVTPLKRARTMDVCHLPLARRQPMLMTEERAWMKSIIRSCWDTLLAEAACERRNRSLTRQFVAPVRTRSATC